MNSRKKFFVDRKFIRKEEYRDYLRSEHWIQLRYRKLVEAGHQCQRCHSESQLEVHHIIYRDNWNDAEPGDLEVLCSRCHKEEHSKNPNRISSRVKVHQNTRQEKHIFRQDHQRRMKDKKKIRF